MIWIRSRVPAPRCLRPSFAAALLLALAVPSLAAPAPEPQEEPSVRIGRPLDGSAVAGPDVLVEIRVEGAVLGGRGRNGAYVLLTLDELPPVKSYSARFTFRGVAAGAHSLAAELRRADGSRYDPAVRTAIAFTVRASSRLAAETG